MKKLLLTLTLMLIINSKLFSQTIQVQGSITDYTLVTLNLVGNDAGSPARNIYEGTHYFGTYAEPRPIRISWQSVKWVLSVDWLNNGVYTQGNEAVFASAPNPPSSAIISWFDTSGVGSHLVNGDGTQTTLLSTNENNFYNENIKVFPNPTTDILNIQSVSTINSLELIDSNGRSIQTIYPNTNTTTINLEKLSIGMYFVKTTTEKGSSIQKIIKN